MELICWPAEENQPGLFMKPNGLHEQSALRASTAAFSGLRSGLTLSKVRSTASKPARKQTAFFAGDHSRIRRIRE
jgi:hypothetical protein